MIRICENCQDDLQEDIRKTFDYAVRMPVSMLKSYMNEEGQVWYNISIQKKKKRRIVGPLNSPTVYDAGIHILLLLTIKCQIHH